MLRKEKRKRKKEFTIKHSVKPSEESAAVHKSTWLWSYLNVLLLELQLCTIFVDDSVELAFGIKAQHLDLIVQAAAGPAAHHSVPFLVLHSRHLHWPDKELIKTEHEFSTEGSTTSRGESGWKWNREDKREEQRDLTKLIGDIRKSRAGLTC